MAKDGTMRGGPRPGQGRPKKALTDKILDGTADEALVLPEPAFFDGEDVPPVKEYLKAKQKNGKEMCAEEIYREVFTWLKARHCELLVSPQLVEQYAMSISRWIQCEEAISEFGFLAKHPTTGNAIASPYVSMSTQYMKQANQIWYQIYQVVKENCSVEYGSTSPHDKNIPLEDYVLENYDLTPLGIIEKLNLIDRDYERLAEGCHYKEALL